MSYKVTDDFNKGVRGIVLFVIVSILVFPVFHLIKGDFCWADSFEPVFFVKNSMIFREMINFENL